MEEEKKEEQLHEHHHHHHHHHHHTERTYSRPAIERLRLALTPFMCINLLGFPTAYGEYVREACGFAPIAFFILSGYLVLRGSEDRSQRIVRAIKRSAAAFALLAAAYFIISFFYCRHFGTDILPLLATGRFWFDFLALNVWGLDVGSGIWYVQALLYAYLIIYLMDKAKLLRFDWLVASVLLLLSFVTGELSGIVKWEVMGYSYLPANFLTCALPYVLLGCFIHRKIHVFAAVHRKWYWLSIPLGVLMMVAEISLLNYFGAEGHYDRLLGAAVVAVSACMLAFKGKIRPGFEAMLGLSRRHVNGIYYLCQPVGAVLTLSLSLSRPEWETIPGALGFLGIFSFLVCFVFMYLNAFIGKVFFRQKRRE